MKAEKEPEEFEFGCEDLTKDWFDEISDMEEPEEKIKCDENDYISRRYHLYGEAQNHDSFEVLHRLS